MDKVNVTKPIDPLAVSKKQSDQLAKKMQIEP